MDAPKHDWRQTAAGCLSVALLLAAGALVGRCSAPTIAAQQTVPQLEQYESNGYDFTDNAGRALSELEVFLHSVTTTTTSPRSESAPKAEPAAPATPTGDRWDQLAQCETGGNWATNTGNGFGGGLQFMHQPSYSTWLSFGGAEFAPHPWDATREQQIDIAERVLASSGYGAWPGCSRKFGWL